MLNRSETHVHVFQLSAVYPFVDVIELNNGVIGYVSENRDWNKKEKPVSLISPDGVHLGDFCCVAHAASHITQKNTGLNFDEVEVMRNVETHVFEVPAGKTSDLLDALMFAITQNMKGKRPH